MNISTIKDLHRVYEFHKGFDVPYFFDTDFESWENSFLNDTDGEGRVLFKELNSMAVYDNDRLLGFVQYGRTAFGFDENGEISGEVSYPVIRNLYFKENESEAGELLLKTALSALGESERVYCFFHYFGMTCFARHGKVFESEAHIEELLKANNFTLEHENVYYSSTLSEAQESEIQLNSGEPSEGNHQYFGFRLDTQDVGGCEVHYVSDSIAYLRWIYINGDITGKGIGTKAMTALKSHLFEKGVKRFDTDTALDNLIAQHYYEKTGFTKEGISRSYYLD